MKKHLPGKVELSVFFVLSLLGAVVATRISTRDASATGSAISMIAFPIFVFAAVFGLWRSGRLSDSATRSIDD